ncbi:hypothetical protein LXM94_23300 [Rhizobium sp. TRM95111]|uniref:hypothetical protein n=1 Tax=Rhizobium alarense TaxID=2846851 RepID=UPI001F440A97|nr:hypothetical protein [Rhizobium alarense]MCF3642897.1 hypothetical protein [Rhizobium alarense]
MIQLILLIAVAVAAWIGYRRFIADAERLARNRRKAEKERETGAIGTLVKDPKTGEYRLRKDGE